MSIKKIRVGLRSRSYDIFIGRELLGKASGYIKNVTKAETIAVITDNNVDALYGDALADNLKAAGFTVCKFAFPHGESSKCHETLKGIYDFLADNNITRTDCVVALGGGVVGDIAGYAAATYLRGISYVQIPTTLLAQVDSSVGGKTAVDLPSGKNLVGAFWQPKLVLIDINTLKTLPDEFLTCGMGEVVKYGMIKSKSLFELLERHDFDAVKSAVNNADNSDLENIIYECVAIKTAIVEHDELEKGDRMLLNFGHTLGHALEKLQNYTGISHGTAISIGMKLITKAAEENKLTTPNLTDRLTNCLQKYNLNEPCPFPIKDLTQAALNDKKRTGGYINIIISDTPGNSYVKKLTIDEFLGFF